MTTTKNDLTDVKHLSGRYEQFRIDAFPSRRFSPESLHQCLDRIVAQSSGLINCRSVGDSFEGRAIRLFSLGTGTIKILLWSQMHGDESTATMAIADILNFFAQSRNEAITLKILSSLQILFVPMLNPDGAARFQRRTAQNIDMNRDALALQTPEARILKNLQHELKPQFGFNLHDQELSTVGTSKNITAIALLAPAFDAAKSTNDVRLRAKQLATVFALSMNELIPGNIARYDDSFEPRAFGDNMQLWGTSTILVESGHAIDDPEKNSIRKLNAVGILRCLDAVATRQYQSVDARAYEELPFNGKRAYDLIIRNVRIDHGGGKTTQADLGISSQVDTHSEPPPKLVDIGDLSTFIGLKEIQAGGKVISHNDLSLGEPFEWAGRVGA